MKSYLQAEVRKLLTIRSTYIISGIALLLTGFVASYVLGYKGDAGDTSLFTTAIAMAAQTVSIFLAIVSVLLVAHEYRYNTIMYTLTASKSRTKIFFSKVIVVSAFALILMAVVCLWSILLTWIGVTIHGGHIIAQQGPWASLTWRMLFYAWGYSMIAMLTAFLVRNIVGALAVVFIVPGTVEGLLSLVLKSKADYLPFTALTQVVIDHGQLSHIRGALVFTIYLIAYGALSWALFIRRDAN